MATKRLFLWLFILFPFVSIAQFFKVYPYQTAEAGEKELVYWFSAIGSDHQYSFFGEDVDRNGLLAHSVELEYGLSNKWTAGLYLDFEHPPGQPLKHIKTKALMFHGRFWEKGERLMKNIQAVIDRHDVGAELTGVAPMFYITFKKDPTGAYKGKRKDFYTQLIRKGFFFTPYHHAYICYRHTREDLDQTVNAIDEALAYVEERY